MDSRIGKWRLRLIIAAAAAAAVASPPTTAQQPKPGEDELEEILVTARYREEKLQTTPLSISALSDVDIQIRGFTSSYEIGYTVPNASLRPAQAAFGSTMTAFIRGIGQNDFDFAFEPGVGIYVDDIYHPFTLGSQIDLLDLERVEVLRGPQGTLFGRGSIGGTIRYVSKKPTGDTGGYIEVTGGEYDRVDVRASYDFSLADGVFARVSGASKSREGYQDVIDFACEHPDLAGNLNPQSVNRGKNCKTGTQGGEDVVGYRGIVRWVAADNLEFSFSGDYLDDNSEARADTITRMDPNAWGLMDFFHESVLGVNYDKRFITHDIYKTYATYDDPLTGLKVDPETGVEKWTASGRMDWQIQENFGTTLILAYSDVEGTLATDADGSPLNMQTVDGVQTIDFWTAELRFHGRVWDRMDWTVGGFYYDGNATNDQMVSIPFLSYILDGVCPVNIPMPPGFPPCTSFGIGPFVDAHNEHEVQNQSAFAHVVFDITDKMALNAGVRYSDDEKNVDFDNTRVKNPNVVVEDDHTDWLVGLDYKWTDNIMTYASVATGYRPGSYNPRPFQVTQVVAVDAEESTAYEIGIKSELFDNRLRLNVAGYFTDWDTRILPVAGQECLWVGDLATGGYLFLVPPGTPGSSVDGLGNNCLPPQLPRTFYENGPAEIQGYEIEATWRVVEGLTLNGSYGKTEWESDDINDGPGVQDDSPVYVPEDNWTVGAEYMFELANGSSITSRVDVYGQSEICTSLTFAAEPGGPPPSKFPGAGCSGAYELVNVRVQWASPEDKWMLAFGVQNAADEEYFLNQFDLTAFAQPAAEGQPAAPRQWYLTARRNL